VRLKARCKFTTYNFTLCQSIYVPKKCNIFAPCFNPYFNGKSPMRNICSPYHSSHFSRSCQIDRKNLSK